MAVVMAQCPRCGREQARDIDSAWHARVDVCGADVPGVVDDECRKIEVKFAYRRGVMDMLAAAKRTTTVPRLPGWDQDINWEAAEREARRLAEVL